MTEQATPRTEANAIPFHSIRLPKKVDGSYDTSVHFVVAGEYQQLERELAEAKMETQRAWGVVNSKTTTIAIIEGNQEAALNSFHSEQKQRRSAEADRDRWRTMAQELALELDLRCGEAGCPALTRFNELNK